MTTKFILKKSFLKKEYITKHQSGMSIAKKVGCSYNTIYLALKKYKIRTRKHQVAICLDCNKEIRNVRSKRCAFCAAKFRWTKPKYRNAHMGENSILYGKCTGGIGWTKYKGINMRSTWETKYATYLDNHNIDWVYSPPYFPIIVKGKKSTYTFDFYLPKTRMYIEIKGYWYPKQKDKYLATLAQYPRIKHTLLERGQLKEMKII